MQYLSAPLAPLGAPEIGDWQAITRFRLHLVVERPCPYGSSVLCDHPRLAAALLHRLTGGFDREVVGALLLDPRHYAIGHVFAYVGTLCAAPVEPRGLLVPALLANASGLVVFHNHPSGDPSPSADDRALTQRLRDAGDVVGIPVLDHIILGEDPRFVSLSSLDSWHAK